MITLDEVVEFIHNHLAYEQNLVSVINDKGEQIPLSHFSELYSYDNATIKVEGMERYSESIYNRCESYKIEYDHDGPVTCHAFIAKAGSPSFGVHTDPDDVIIYCCDGIKVMMVDDVKVSINVGEDLHIPANTPHVALNETSAFTLSFGLENYLNIKAKKYELDSLPKNNGNM